MSEPHYPGHFEWRRISHAGELIGLEEIDDGVWSVYFAHHLLARLDEQLGRLIEVPV